MPEPGRLLRPCHDGIYQRLTHSQPRCPTLRPRHTTIDHHGPRHYTFHGVAARLRPQRTGRQEIRPAEKNCSDDADRRLLPARTTMQRPIRDAIPLLAALMFLFGCGGSELVGIHVDLQQDGSGTVTVRSLAPAAPPTAAASAPSPGGARTGARPHPRATAPTRPGARPRGATAVPVRAARSRSSSEFGR